MNTTIHSKTGAVEEHLTTLGDIVSDNSKKLLEETAETVYENATLRDRARWWYRQNPATAVLAAIAIGLVSAIAVSQLIQQRYAKS